MTDAADPAAAAWFFDCRAWLDAARGDGATERRLVASHTDPRTARARVQYQVGAEADGCKGGGTLSTASKTCISIHWVGG